MYIMVNVFEFDVVVVVASVGKDTQTNSAKTLAVKLALPTLPICVYDAPALCALNTGHCINMVASVCVNT